MSREIDILVQNHIISRPDPNYCEQCGGPLKETVEDGCVVGVCSVRPLPEGKDSDPAPYSTDIAAAWQVLGALCPVDIDLSYFADQDAWRCNIGNGPLTRRYRMPQDEWQATAPLAICFAALKAVGVAVSEEHEPPSLDCDEQSATYGRGN